MDEDAGNLLIRMQFKDWPKESLAQIHASNESMGKGHYFGSYYKIQHDDRFIGKIFFKIRGHIYDMVSMNSIGCSEVLKKNNILYSKIKYYLGNQIIGNGLWEIIFKMRISKKMDFFIKNFNPDIIYCQGYSYGFAVLPVMISKKYNIPIVFQTTDDWMSYTYKKNPMKFLLQGAAKKLVTRASINIAFGEKMKLFLEKKYNKMFYVSYHLDDLSRFDDYQKSQKDLQQLEKSIVYIGNLAMQRDEAFIDLLSAVIENEELSKYKIKIKVYCSGLPKNISNRLLNNKIIDFLPMPKHEEVPYILKRACVLFLPESFRVSREEIEYAISTKAHLYMMSKKPILVYGPSYSGTVDYAKKYEWGYVVENRSITHLGKALMVLISDYDIIKQLREKSEKCIAENHDMKKGIKKMYDLFESCINNK